jgi:hypothetical protein
MRGAALIAVLACRPVAPVVERPPEIAEVVPTLADRLDARAVTDDDFARARLFSWTSPAQIEMLRSSRVLLTADASTGGRMSPYSRLVAELAPRDPVAKLLRDDPRLRARRYAWPSPYATVLGRGPERYGTALVRIELRSDALIARLDPSGQPPFAFVDLRGDNVPIATVLDDPSRIAAIFHVQTQSGTPARFREYVVVNEAMIDRWEVGTDAIAAQVADDIALLQALAEGPFADLPDAHTRWPASPRWRSKPAHANMVTRWHATLAFDNVRYRPTPDNLAATIAALRDYDPAGAPLEVHTAR